MNNVYTHTKTRAADPPELILRLRRQGKPAQPGLTERVRALVQNMQKSGLFERLQLEEWEGAFFGRRIDPALALAFLCCKIVRQTAADIVDFEEDIKELLEPLLGEDVDSFLEEYQTCMEEGALLREQIVGMQQFYQRLEEHLCHAANAITGELVEQFDAFRARLLAINEKREQIAEQIYPQLDALTAHMETLSTQVISQAQRAEKAAGMAQGQQKRLQIAIKAAKAGVDKV